MTTWTATVTAMAGILAACADTSKSAPLDTDSADSGGACVPNQLRGAVEATLTTTAGCGDIEIYALDDAASTRLSFSATGQLETHFQGTDEDNQMWFFDELPGQRLHLTVQTGADLDADLCTTAPTGASAIDAHYVGLTGTLYLVALSQVDDWRPGDLATGYLRGTDLSFVGPGGRVVTMPCLDASAAIGWEPG